MAITARCPKIPKFLLLILYILSVLKRFISSVFRKMGLSSFSDSTEETSINPQSESVVATAKLIKKILPIKKFEELETHDQESCAICLCEFEKEDEIRPLIHCCHIFHGSCLDGWMDHDQRTCPLCRTPFVHLEMQNAFKESFDLSESDYHLHQNPVLLVG